VQSEYTWEQALLPRQLCHVLLIPPQCLCGRLGVERQCGPLLAARPLQDLQLSAKLLAAMALSRKLDVLLPSRPQVLAVWVPTLALVAVPGAPTHLAWERWHSTQTRLHLVVAAVLPSCRAGDLHRPKL